MIIVVDAARSFGRGVAQGVADWVADEPARGWLPRLEVATAEPSRDRCSAWHADGAITDLDAASPGGEWLAARMPTVFVGRSGSRTPQSAVCSDVRDIVRLAVEHLQSRGLRRLAWYAPGGGPAGRPDVPPAVVQSIAERHHCPLHVFAPRGAEASLPAWLEALPKPVGVVVIDDVAGVDLLRACRAAGLRVPDDVAAVAIGDDELLCSIAVPQLSSVRHNLRVLGRTAARLLDERLAGSPVRAVTVPPVAVMVRGSSDGGSIEDADVRRAIRFVEAHGTEEISPDGVADALGVPRRGLERKFQRFVGRSIRDEIARTRLATARRLLAESDMKLLAVAVRSGFAGPSRLCTVFKAAFGVSPAEFRRAARSSGPSGQRVDFENISG